jgi:phosphomannomutase
LDKVRQKYKKYGKEDFIDGYSLESEDWRFNLRASNTQPLLRLNVEAKKKTLVEKIKKEIEQLIHE